MPSLADGTGLPKPVFLHLKHRYLPSRERCLRLQGMDKARELRKGAAHLVKFYQAIHDGMDGCFDTQKPRSWILEGRIIHCKRDKYQPADPQLNCLWNFTACLWIS